jgi:mono/diheme cytochrome c family protein
MVAFAFPDVLCSEFRFFGRAKRTPACRRGIDVKSVPGLSNAYCHRKWRLIAAFLSACAVFFVRPAAAAGTDPPAAESDKTYLDKARPIFAQHCVECHSGKKARADLDLSSFKSLLAGSRSGEVISPGKSKQSLLYRVLQPGHDPHMPPKKQLTAAEIQRLAGWIDTLKAGPLALKEKVVTDKDRQFWSFVPPRRAALPAVKDRQWPRTDVDSFILAALEAQGFAPAPEAGRLALIRRATFDLTGLPPTPEEVKEFLADPAGDAYQKLIERLLSSPRYGERWGRHWLDVARYADSDGFEFDVDRPHAYTYRDYVIRSFNQDKPYDRFILEQIAGDELAPGDPEALTATGFCRNGPTIDNQQNEKNRLDELDDVVATTGSVFLGLTVGCARCHDHKYDPIPQRDYYRMLAIFNSLQKKNLPIGPRTDAAAIVGKIEELRRRVEGLTVAVDGETADQEKARLERIRDLRRQLKELEERSARHLLAQCIVDAGPKARPTFLLVRGDHRTPGDEVQPGVLTVLARAPLLFPTPAPAAKTTGRRLTLARWIASPDNPLTARVMVNRIWQYHFGRGLIESSSNFGLNGAEPSHPELLDWLATEFVKQRWSVKAMHRLIMNSAVYRQTSRFDAAKAKLDPDNRLLWRFPKLRLEAEAIRDSILHTSGNLNLTMYGPGIKPRIDPGVIATGSTPKWPKVDKEGPEHWRRSVYIFIKRSVLMPMMESFDAPTATQSCERRIPTTVAPQALQLLNGQFTNEQAAAFALRVRREAAATFQAQAERAWWLALCRPPTEIQLREAVTFLDEQRELHRRRLADGPDRDSRAEISALTDFCHVLLNLNEFVYVD